MATAIGISEVVDFALRNLLPSSLLAKEAVEAGGLMSYGSSWPDAFRRGASMVDKILSVAANAPGTRVMMFDALNLPHRASTVGKYVTVRVGGSTTTPGPGESYILLIDAADEALYEAKRKGEKPRRHALDDADRPLRPVCGTMNPCIGANQH
jgi:GGDEF domain-containing protein